MPQIEDEVVTTEQIAPAIETVAPSPALEAPSEPTSVRDSVRASLETLKGQSPDGAGDKAALPSAAERSRDDKGRFAGKQERDTVNEIREAIRAGKVPPKPQEKIDAEAALAAEASSAPAAIAAPPGWSVKSKSEWDRLPGHVREDIARREAEVSQGFAEYKGLGRFMEQAKRSGTTLDAALESYTGIEALLRQNPVQGILRIAQNVGFHPLQLAEQIMTAFGKGGGTPQPQPHQQAPADDITALYPEFGQLINPLASRLEQTEGVLQRMLQADQDRQATAQQAQIQSSSTEVERFAADPKNRYFDNVAPLINQLFKGGVVPRTGNHAADLAKAYELACQMDPDVREQLTQERLAKLDEERRGKATAARKVAVSLNGAPANGAAAPFSNGAGSSVRDSVRAAFEQARSQV